MRWKRLVTTILFMVPWSGGTCRGAGSDWLVYCRHGHRQSYVFFLAFNFPFKLVHSMLISAQPLIIIIKDEDPPVYNRTQCEHAKWGHRSHRTHLCSAESTKLVMAYIPPSTPAPATAMYPRPRGVVWTALK